MPHLDVSLYLRRLKLNAEDLDELPTAAKLCALQEAHLCEIPFENTAQHGVHGGPSALDIATMADKVLVNRRGGICYEVNVLFAELLRALGYDVTLTLASMFITTLQKYIPYSSHVTLIVRVHDGTLWLADVGLAEPPIHAIRYDRPHFGVAQTTPEGMQSKVTISDDGDTTELWWFNNSAWRPRFRFSYRESLLVPGAQLDDLQPGLDAILSERSPFAKGIIVCCLTRTTKTTLAGNRIKITSNRFQDAQTVEERYLRSVDEARQVLRDTFGVPLESTRGLTIDLSGKDEIFSFM